MASSQASSGQFHFESGTPDSAGSARGSRLATFDQAMAKLHNDVVDLVPDS